MSPVKAFLDGEKHRPALGNQPWHPTRELDLHLPGLTTGDEYSLLIKALLKFALHARETDYSDQTYTSSFEIGSEEVWERFVGAVRQKLANGRDGPTVVFRAFIEERLRFWIDTHPRDGQCVLHLNMTLKPPHDTFMNEFTHACMMRLKCVNLLYPSSRQGYLSNLAKAIKNTGSEEWKGLNKKQPDATLSYRGHAPEFPGIIIEIGSSQEWNTRQGVKNKAIGYVDDSKGGTNGVLYLNIPRRQIAMIGSERAFPKCRPAKRLDNSFSKYAREVIPLTSLTDSTYEKCLLPFQFAHFGCGDELLNLLEPEEKAMGFFFTFKEILQMMESIDHFMPGANSPKHIPSERLENPWEIEEALQISLFKTPPESPQYDMAST